LYDQAFIDTNNDFVSFQNYDFLFLDARKR